VDYYIIGGDFNSRHETWDSFPITRSLPNYKRGIALHKIMKKCKYTNINDNTYSTYSRTSSAYRSVIDLVWVNTPVLNILQSSGFYDMSSHKGFDHNIIYFTVRLSGTYTETSYQIFKSVFYTNQALCESVTNEIRSRLSIVVDSMREIRCIRKQDIIKWYNLYNKKINGIIKRRKMKKTVKRSFKPWITKQTQTLIYRKYDLVRKLVGIRRNRSMKTKLQKEVRCLSREIDRQNRKAKLCYEKEQLLSSSEKDVYSLINRSKSFNVQYLFHNGSVSTDVGSIINLLDSKFSQWSHECKEYTTTDVLALEQSELTSDPYIVHNNKFSLTKADIRNVLSQFRTDASACFGDLPTIFYVSFVDGFIDFWYYFATMC
jgi:hypothetical protein